MPDVARIDQVCDAVADRIAELWNPVPPDAVTASDLVDINTNPRNGPVQQGRQVYVLPDSYDSPDAATRAEDVNDYTVVVLVAELYLGPDLETVAAGRPGREWVRERRLWVQDTVFKPLTDPRSRLLADADVPGSGLWSVAPSAVETVYDLEELRDRKLFLSVLRLTFREHADA